DLKVGPYESSVSNGDRRLYLLAYAFPLEEQRQVVTATGLRVSTTHIEAAIGVDVNLGPDAFADQIEIRGYPRGVHDERFPTTAFRHRIPGSPNAEPGKRY
ncbi:hypothetical protein KAU45_01245, partial [bacterium]|nr:hypothetical protein [bacterium]